MSQDQILLEQALFLLLPIFKIRYTQIITIIFIGRINCLNVDTACDIRDSHDGNYESTVPWDVTLCSLTQTAWCHIPDGNYLKILCTLNLLDITSNVHIITMLVTYHLSF
jgi:hypothetical protein